MKKVDKCSSAGTNDDSSTNAQGSQVCQPIAKPNVTCRYSIAWVGLCNKDADERGFCEEHRKEKCSSCGSQATHSCYETMGMVCGAPLCDNCEHTIQSNGCNSEGKLPDGYKMHCKKDSQVYKPWYMSEAEVNEINLSEKVKILEGKVDKLSALHTVFGPPPVDDEKDSAELEHYFKSLKVKTRIAVF